MNAISVTRRIALGTTATFLALGAAVGFAGPATAAESPNPLTDIENSLVHVVTTYTGWVQYPTEAGWEWSHQIDVQSACTGWFASDEGHIATAGHCVEVDASVRDAIIYQFLVDLDREDLFATAQSWTVEGYEDGSDVDRTVHVIQPHAALDPVIEDYTVAQVIDFQSFEDGDAALLRVAGATGTVPLPIAQAAPAVGDDVTSIGFPASVEGVADDRRLAASFKTGTVSSRQVTDAGVPVTEINAQVSGGMSGGPTVDGTGSVIGINSFGINGESQSFNFVTDTESLASFLESHGVDPVIAGSMETTGEEPPRRAAVADVSAGDSGTPQTGEGAAEEAAPVAARTESDDGAASRVVGLVFAALVGAGMAAVPVVMITRARKRLESGKRRESAALTTPAAAAGVRPAAGAQW
ncbi:serine protease [Microbacterium sp. NPDC056569]|uniref:S1 family peptidase n=1 Tax=Microbacterium sp. NPDC056569 TaxID=3345867 RepID=UPI003672D5B6